MLLRILLYKKQRLRRKYLLQLYSNCCYTEQWQNLAISSTTWRRVRSVHAGRHIFTHEHFSTNPHILSSGYHVLHLFMPLFCCTSVSYCLCTLNFYIIQMIYEQSESPVPSRTNLSCRRAGLLTLCKDSEL